MLIRGTAGRGPAGEGREPLGYRLVRCLVLEALLRNDQIDGSESERRDVVGSVRPVLTRGARGGFRDVGRNRISTATRAGNVRSNTDKSPGPGVEDAALPSTSSKDMSNVRSFPEPAHGPYRNRWHRQRAGRSLTQEGLPYAVWHMSHHGDRTVAGQSLWKSVVRREARCLEASERRETQQASPEQARNATGVDED